MGKKIFIFGFIFVLLAAIPLTVYFVKFQTSQSTNAAPSTTLGFSPPTQAVGVGQTFSSDITIDPGSNQVSVVKLNITYDSSKIATAGAGLVINTNAFPQTLDPITFGPCNGTFCTITTTVAIGIDTTKAITTKTTVGTLNLKAITTTDQNPTNVAFGSSTTVFSVAQSDQGSENVLSSTNPLAVTITATGPISPTPPGGGNISPTPISGGNTITPAPTQTAQDQPPVCTSLSVDRNTATPGGTINFTANGNDSDGTIGKVTFNFGDGSVQDVTTSGGIGTNSVSSQQAHTYQNAGSFTTTAIMTDNANLLSNPTTCSQTISIGTSSTSGTITPTPTTGTIVTLPKTGPGEILVGIGAIGAIISIVGGVIFFAL